MRLLRGGLLLGIVALLTAGQLNADQDEKKEAPATRAPWQRQLPLFEQLTANLLSNQIKTAIQEQKWDTAIQAAEKLDRRLTV